MEKVNWLCEINLNVCLVDESMEKTDPVVYKMQLVHTYLW